MIQQLNGRKNDENAGKSPDIRMMLMLANSLDSDALSALFARQQRVGIIAVSSDLEVGLARCRQLLPKVLVIDPKMAFDVVPRVAEAIQQRHVRHAIVLDDRLHEGRLAAILKMPAMSYMTRLSGFSALLAATVHVATQGERVFDPSFADRVQRTPRGWRLEQAHGRPTVAALTSRELQVMKLLARGRSVRDCAEQLQLAESTIDNHKSRLMKKLQVHKAAELTRLAIRDGLIAV